MFTLMNCCFCEVLSVKLQVLGLVRDYFKFLSESMSVCFNSFVVGDVAIYE